MISSINNFPSISSLKTLSISNNNLNDLSSFITSAKTKYPTLNSLNTFRNPMNPGVNQAQQYSQYKSYIRQIGKLTELDGMNINDNSFMSQQQQPKEICLVLQLVPNQKEIYLELPLLQLLINPQIKLIFR